MSLLSLDPRTAADLARHGDYLALALERAAGFARRVHAQEVALEHLLCVVLEDEEAALTALVLHAFADPETIRHEVLALAPGVLVVTAARCTPFSPGGVRTLRAARALSSDRGTNEVLPEHLAESALPTLDEEVRAILREAGLARGIEAANPVDSAPPEDVLRTYGQPARRAVAAAARLARSLGREAITPAHLLVAALEQDAAAEESLGLTASRARLVLSGRDEDPAPVPSEPIEPDELLTEVLGTLPDGAGTLELLAWLHGHGSDGLRELFLRQKVGPELLERAGRSFRDPGTR